MVGLSRIITHVYPQAIPLKNFTVSDTGTGERITQWNEAILGTTPVFTDGVYPTLEAQRAAAQAEEDTRIADEIDANNERQQLKALVQDLKNGTGTNTERLARVEKACARLIKDS